MKASPEEQGKILTLQGIDSKIAQLHHQGLSLPLLKTLEEKTIAFNSTRDFVIAAQTEKADIKHELSRSEIDVEQVVSRIDRDEKRLASGNGSPKDLEKLQHELGSLAKRRSELEEVELEIMVLIEGIDARIKALSEQRDGLHSEVTQLEAERVSALSRINDEIALATSQRALLVPTITKEVVDLYEKVRASSDGVGAAALVEGKCDGCHLSINAVEIGRIKALPVDEIIRCEECNRILIKPPGF